MILHVVKTEIELKDWFRKLLQSIDVPHFDFGGRDTVAADIDGRRQEFDLVFKLNPTARDVDRIGGKMTRKPVLLASVRLSSSVIERCRRLNINFADLNGRVWIRGKGILIDRNEPVLRGTFSPGKQEIDFFHKKSSRLSRALLGDQGRIWKQDELASCVGISQSLLSRLLRHASTQGWVEGRRGDWRLSDFDGLLDAWAGADNWDGRVAVRQYSTLESDLKSVASSLVKTTKGRLAFTQWFAANLRHPYADVPVVSAYRESFPDDLEQTKLGLRTVVDGGNLWVIAPSDEGVFQFLREVDGLPLACDAQIYLDLLQVGLRGPDQAAELRKWKEFCKR